MLEGLMQHDHPLTLQLVLERMRGMNGDAEVVTLTDDGTTRATYAEVGERVDRLCRGLRELGVGDGDRVATFAWNSQHHLEAYLAAPCMGAVLHTLNIRLFPEQLVYVVNHAQDKVILVDASLVAAARAARRPVRDGRALRRDGRRGPLQAPGRDQLRGAARRQEPGFDYPEIDERRGRGAVLHERDDRQPEGRRSTPTARTSCTRWRQRMADAFGISRADRILPVVPMFHANAWGLPYAACMAGASLIMPGRFLQAEPLARLIESEKVTVAGAVPTIWLDVLRWSDEHKPDLSSIRIVACGGSAVPRRLMQAFEERHGVRIIQALGHDRDEPARLRRPPAGRRRADEEHWDYRSTAGRIMPRRRGAADRRRRRGGAVGRRVDRRAAGARPVDRRARTTRTPTPARSSTTAGCAPATSARSTSAATSASPTARRTSSSPAASGSPRSTSRTS